MAEQVEQVLAAFLLDDPVGARRFLAEIRRIDANDPGVRIVDAAIADRTKRGRVKVHQTEDTGGLKGGARGTVIGVVVGTILLGPAGPLVGGVVGGTFGGLHNRIRDIGIDDKFMREVTGGIDKGKSALFVLYEGDWSASIGSIGDLVKSEQAQLIQSTLPPDKAAALAALVAPVVEELGGEEAVADYEVETEASTDGEAEPATEAEGSADLTRIVGVDPDAAAALVGAGVVTYTQLASTSEPDARRILSDAGITAPGNVETWAMQASFAANGDWPGLDAYLRASQPDSGAGTPGSEGAAGGDDLTQLNGIGPKAAEALTKAGIATYAALAQANEPQVRRALHESEMSPPAGVGTWPMQASFAARGDWKGLLRYNQKRTRATPAKAAAPASRPASATPDDLTQIRGIGPRMAAILSDYEITTYADLERVSTEQLREMVALGGILPPATLDTWPAQAGFAARGDWQGLAAYNQRHR